MKIKNLYWIWMSLVFTLSFSGCNSATTISTPDGKIPEAYLATAAGYEGRYSGTFSAGDYIVLAGTNTPLTTSGVLSISFNGDTPLLRFDATGGGNDILDPSCNSSIGVLQSIVVDKATLKSANFQFSPGTCANLLLGRTLTLSFADKKSSSLLQAFVYVFTAAEPRGCDEGSSAAGLASPCYYKDIYWEGSFSK